MYVGKQLSMQTRKEVCAYSISLPEVTKFNHPDELVTMSLLKKEVCSRKKSPRYRFAFNGVEWFAGDYYVLRKGQVDATAAAIDFKPLTAGEFASMRLFHTSSSHSGGSKTADQLNLSGILGMPPRTKFSGKRKLNALLTRMICAT